MDENETLSEKVERCEDEITTTIVKAISEVFSHERPLPVRAALVSGFADGQLEILVGRHGIHVRPRDAPDDDGDG